MAFISKSDLERHNVIHSGEKEFVCRFCLGMFNRRDNLTGHERKCHDKIVTKEHYIDFGDDIDISEPEDKSEANQ